MPTDAPTPTPDEQPRTDAGHDGVAPAHGGHGTSVAAWVSTLGVTFGALVVAVAMIFVWVPVIIVGVVVIVLAALAGPVLARAGYGAHGPAEEYTGKTRAVR